jgi:serine/threonine protein kinase
MGTEGPATPVTIGRYRIEAELGRGAMGTVYRARDPRIDRLVALKVLRPQAQLDPETAEAVKQRFLNEGRAAGRLNHPNIVTVYDADEDAATGLAYIAMEHVEGVELRELTRRGLDPERLADVLGQVAAALDHAHERGVIHRDVKPANVLVSADGLAKLTDFGIARLGSSTMTQDGAFLGSPAYMSPEQVRGERVTRASDVFSLGVVAYEALTGRKPFEGADLVSTTHSIANEEPKPPSVVAPTLSRAVDGVLARALAKRPEDRPASAGELARELRRAVAAARARPATSSERSSRWARPAVAAALVIVAGLVAWIAFGGSDEQPAQPSDGGSGAVRWEEIEASAAPEPPPVEPARASRPAEGPEPRSPAPVGTPSASEEPPAASTPPADEAAARSRSDPPTPTGRLRIELYTFHSGTLIVKDGEEVVGRTPVAKLERKGFRLKNPKRRFELVHELPAGRRILSFIFVVEDGKTLRRRSVRDVPEDGSLRVIVDIGTLGKDIDVRFP